MDLRNFMSVVFLMLCLLVKILTKVSLPKEISMSFFHFLMVSLHLYQPSILQVTFSIKGILSGGIQVGKKIVIAHILDNFSVSMELWVAGLNRMCFCFPVFLLPSWVPLHSLIGTSSVLTEILRYQFKMLFLKLLVFKIYYFL